MIYKGGLLIFFPSRSNREILKNCANLFMKKLLVTTLIHVFEDLPGLAFKYFTDFFEGGETDGFGFATFQYAHIGNGNAHPLTEFGKAHFAAGQHDIEVYNYGHIRWLGPVLFVIDVL